MLELLSWLQSLRVSRTNRTARRRCFVSRPARLRRIRLGVEILEDRTVPSTLTWVGGASGDWDNPVNWSSGKVPGAADDVVINTANATITHKYGSIESIHSLTTGSTDTLNWSAGSLYISSASTLQGALNLSGGTWLGGGNLTLDKLLTWTGGTMTGSGTTTANAGIDFSGSGSETLDGRTLYNASGSTATWSGSNSIGLYDGAVFDNEAGATFNINLSGSEAIAIFGAIGTFKNQGTVNVAAATNTETINAQLVNSGTVNVNSGVLDLAQVRNSAGTFSAAAGATLGFGGISQLGSSSKVAGAGTFDFYGPTVDVLGTYDITGTTTIKGDATFTGTLTSLGSTVNISGTANIAKSVSIPTLNLDGGTLTGPAALTVTSTLNWLGGGSMRGTGSTTLANGATLNLGGDATTEILDSRTFNNAGTAYWKTGSSNFELDDGAKFNNESGANFNAQSGKAIDSTTGATPAFNNAGTYTQSTGITFNGVSFNNSGTVNVSKGTLLLEADGNDTAGVFNVASGAALEFYGPNTVTHLGSSIGTSTDPSAGSVIFDEYGTDFTGNADLGSNGVTTVSSGTVNFLGTLTSLGEALVINGSGRANIANSVTIPFLDLEGGTLGGTGAVTVSKALYWNNGSPMIDTGSTTLAKGATMSLGGDGSSQLLDARTFNNYGNVSWAGNSGAFYMYNGAVFNNGAGASFTANADKTIDDLYGTTAKFNNAGTFTKVSADSGTTEFANVLFNNTGTVNVNSGILELDTGGTDSAGAFKVASGGRLYFAGGTTTLASSITASVSTLPPIVLFSGGTTDVTGTYNLANGVTTISGATVNFTASSTLTNLGLVTISSGTANFSANTTIPTLDLTGGTLTGSGAVTISSQLTWDGDSTMSGTGSTTLAASGTATLGGNNSEPVLDGRTFNNAGKITMPINAIDFIMLDQAVFNNETGATFTGTDYAWFSPYAFGLATFNNAGTFSAGDTWFGGVTFNNTGKVNLPTNAPFEMDSGGSNSGAFVLGSGASLDLEDGFDNFSASTASITGAGSVFVGVATVYFGGTYDITGDTSVGEVGVTPNGTAYFLDGGSTGTIGADSSGGTMELAAGTTFKVTNGNCNIGNSFGGGSLYLNGGTLALAAGNSVVIDDGGALYGPGTIDGNLDNGDNSPFTGAGAAVYVGGGQFPGTLTVNGNYAQDDKSTLFVNVGGLTAGTQYDQMKISGTATLNGTLSVSLINNYKPSSGAFDILTYASHSGDFATKDLPSGWSASPGSTAYVATA